MIVQKEKKIIPQDQQKLGTMMNGKDSMISFFEESIGISCDDGKIDFKNNQELLEILNNN